MSESEPFEEIPKVFDGIKTEEVWYFSGQVLREPAYWQFGTRYIGGMTFTQAILRNKGSWMTMQRENRKMRSIKGDIIDASFSGGPGCISDEASVMGVERRTWAIWFKND